MAALPVRSSAEILLAAQLEQGGIPFHREFRFAPPRKFRADFMVMSVPRLLIEVEGGTWVAGRHSRGKGFEADTEKQFLAMLLGYRYLRVTTAQVEDGRALSWIEQLAA